MLKGLKKERASSSLRGPVDIALIAPGLRQPKRRSQGLRDHQTMLPAIRPQPSSHANIRSCGIGQQAAEQAAERRILLGTFANAIQRR